MPLRGPRLLTVLVTGLVAAGAHAQAASAEVVLNEVNCEGTDWVELVNTSGTQADLSGWILSDDPLDPPGDQFVVPEGTTIAANDDLVLESNPPWSFGISCSGADTIRLGDDEGNQVAEEFISSQVTPGETWGRYPNATGAFGRTVATKGSANQPSSGGGPGEDLAAWMFDPSVVVEIDLDLPQSSIDALALDPKEYVDGTFSLTTTGGSYGPLAVGVRLKGSHGSFRSLTGKAAFKLKFNHSVSGQRFLGLEKLTLNNMVQDPSNVHEVLAYESFRAMGIPAPRTGYAYVRVNGSDYGLYLNLETMDRVALPRWLPSTQHLYESVDYSDVLPGSAELFEVDEGSESNRDDLEALIAGANDADGDWSDGMADVAHLDQITLMWAVERYVGQFDGYTWGPPPWRSAPNNYYLHSEADGRFRMLPWGMDQSWVWRLSFLPRGGTLFRSCYEDPSCFESFRSGVHAARSTISGLDLDSLAASTAETLAPWQAQDPRREYSLAAISEGVAVARAFIAARPGDVDDPALWPDVAAPETVITKAPRAVIRTKRRRVPASFSFSGSEPGLSYECRLDDRAWGACSSPRAYLVGRGRHTFLVRATDAAGNAEPGPARYEWRVRRPARRRTGSGSA